MSNDELNLYRLKKIQDLVEYAYKYVPFYRKLWERYNLDWREKRYKTGYTRQNDFFYRIQRYP